MAKETCTCCNGTGVCITNHIDDYSACMTCNGNGYHEYKEEAQDWYFTFGYGHNPGIGYYAVYHGTFSEAREQMVRDYNDKWSFQYPSAEAAGVDRFNLKQVS
jgi:hypothetical protein